MAEILNTQVLLDCEVKPGPFSTERLVRVVSNYDQEEWVGFVPVHELKDESTEEGRNQVRATVITETESYLIVRIPGEALSQRTLYIPPNVLRGDAVEA